MAKRQPTNAQESKAQHTARMRSLGLYDEFARVLKVEAEDRGTSIEDRGTYKATCERDPRFNRIAMRGGRAVAEAGNIDMISQEQACTKPQGTHREAADWATANLYVAHIEFSTAPSMLAWTYYLVGRKDPTAFIEKIASKLLPSRTEIDREDSLTDDGSDLVGTYERLESIRSAVLQDGAQAVEAESAV